MDIFLIGHGAWNPNDTDSPSWFTVPDGVQVQFYVAHQHKFDSDWERAIRQGLRPNHHDFKPQLCAAGSRCINYWLTIPGGIRSMADRVLPIDPLHGTFAVSDGCTYALPDGSLPWHVSLQRICETCAGHAGGVVVHWFACRDEVGYKGVSVAALEQEAVKGFLGKLPLESAGWKPKQDVPVGAVAKAKALMGKQ